ncbi:cell division protein FtsN [Klebsiella aerogenes]|nr:cell division protein FtsN [Klebsiella aerogenes]
MQQQPRVQQPKPVQQQQPKQTASNQQPYQDLLQTPAHTNTTQPRTQAAAPVTRVEEAPKAAEKKDDRSWMIQCGSFKGAEQAETVRAQLAFEGFASHITTNNGWNRVVIGPLKGKESANEMITRLKMAGHANWHSSRRQGLKPSKSPPSIIAFGPADSAGPLFRFCNQGVCS